jgi:hypothetical protein
VFIWVILLVSDQRALEHDITELVCADIIQVPFFKWKNIPDL